MNRVPVTLGIPVGADPLRLWATLVALRAHTDGAFRVVLLAPAGDPAHSDPARWPTPAGLTPPTVLLTREGGAAAFNRLATFDDAAVVVLLECGAVVGPGWLDLLLAALAVHPRHGLAGPSTNQSWNEQRLVPAGLETLDGVRQDATRLAHRFGASLQTLAPLHSLSDFCYAVRREVIETIGCADEGYGQGPCWEMDYNVRAARAGWIGVWVRGAYVRRSPPDPARRAREAAAFENNKRRYQDKFCGARLRGAKTDYRLHCRGDACPNFAPAQLIRIHENPAPNPPLPLPSDGRRAGGEGESRGATTVREPRVEPMNLARSPSSGSIARSHPLPSDGRGAGGEGVVSHESSALIADPPRVSCIMPTYNRVGFVRESVARFLRQTVRDAELVIVDDGTDRVRAVLPDDPRIRLLELDSRRNTGAKRNLACAQARAEIIVHWDDDDWYPDDRLERQLAAFRAEAVQVSGTSTLYYHDARTNHAWRYAYRFAAGPRPWVAGNTLAYRTTWWRLHPFPEIQVGEDSRFVWAASARSVADLADPSLCVARVHSGNTSPKRTRGSCWLPCEVGILAGILKADWDTFAAPPGSAHESPLTPNPSSVGRKRVAPAREPGQADPTRFMDPTRHSQIVVATHNPTLTPSPSPVGREREAPAREPAEADLARPLPLISCIMPTRDRRAFVELALRGFDRQDYPRRELIIVDDGREDLSRLVADRPDIQLLRVPRSTSIGRKRRLACESARGDFIAHCDDDDWYGPTRLSHQAAPLIAGEADLTGLENAFTLDLATGRFWATSPALHARMFVGDVHGGTLVFRKALLNSRVGYPDRNIAEDAMLIHLACQSGARLRRLPNAGLFVYVRHGRNSWRFQAGEFLQPAGWTPVEAPPAFVPWLKSYQACVKELRLQAGRPRVVPTR